jgi:hypothetical protein
MNPQLIQLVADAAPGSMDLIKRMQKARLSNRSILIILMAIGFDELRKFNKPVEVAQI